MRESILYDGATLLRPLSQMDVDDYHTCTNDFDIVKMTGSFPWPFTREFVVARLHRLTYQPREQGQAFAIEEGGQFCGSIGLLALIAENRYMLGFHLAKPAWGKGIMSRACQLIVDWAPEVWGPHIAVEAGHFIDNPASGRVLEKVGFVKTGEIKPVLCTSRGTNLPSVEYIWRPEGV
ncbi:MAG: GNAT family N-acetyltransferase [Pseudomonadota bacterium]